MLQEQQCMFVLCATQGDMGTQIRRLVAVVNCGCSNPASDRHQKVASSNMRSAKPSVFEFCDPIYFREVNAFFCNISYTQQRNPFGHIAPNSMQAVLNVSEDFADRSKWIATLRQRL